MIKWSTLLLIIMAVLSIAKCQTCSQTDDQFLITFHPHLDAFWLNTDTQLKNINWTPAGFLYNMNQRNSKTIFNSMLAALSDSVHRKYFVTQIVFFKDWYDYLPLDKKSKVKELLLNGQLQIANGGWVENDQAVCYYDDIIDQYTLGMNFLYNKFDYQVKIGWATDSFGHSHSQAACQHLLGIQMQGIERVDDRYVNQHKGGALLQFYWTPISDSNNLTYGGVLNHVRHFLHEVNNFRGARSNAIKQDFEQIQRTMKNSYHKNKLFRFLGNDFQQFITEQFVNLQSAMKDLNTKNSATCPAFKYGNPTDYLDIITKYYDKNTLPTRAYDFIPNWDQDRYWTGYYTTDPSLKKACKDFSRLVNFFRKSLLTMNTYKQNQQLLEKSEQLLAVLQHHDGITATSKTYIEDEFIERVKNKSNSMRENLKKMHGGSDSVFCDFLANNNQCQIPDIQINGPETRQLYILGHGGNRKQKIQLVLPIDTYYDLIDQQEDIFCQEQRCNLVFEANLHSGVNKYVMSKKPLSDMKNQVFQLKDVTEGAVSGSDYSFVFDPSKKNQFKYQYFSGSQYFTVGLYTSPNQGSSRQTMAWDKYGRKMDKTQHVVPGMYIMGNSGTIQPLNIQFTAKKFAQGKIYKRLIANSATSKIKLTIKNDQPNIIDLVHNFTPSDRGMKDYFLKVESSVKSSTLYHDSNGFLVSKRILNSRPDYEFQAKPQDTINGNTYPACTFAYLINNNKKFLFFTDRAQGVASYQQSLLINFDRLAMDDGKGVGEGYYRVNKNIFRYKFAVLSSQDDTQRTWQRSYDQGLFGFFSKGSSSSIIAHKSSDSQISGPTNNLKYTIFYVSENEIVLRLQNLGQFANLMLGKYQGSQGAYQWNIDELGLNLKFTDIKESYANGIPKQVNGKTKWRRHWGTKQDQINNLSQDRLDSDRIGLRPLQMRSFRIALKGLIANKQFNVRVSKNNPVLKQIHESRPVQRNRLRKRCF